MTTAPEQLPAEAMAVFEKVAGVALTKAEEAKVKVRVAVFNAEQSELFAKGEEKMLVKIAKSKAKSFQAGKEMKDPGGSGPCWLPRRAEL